MEDIKDNEKKFLLTIGILMLFAIPMLLIDTIEGGFVKSYFSVLAVLLLSPIIMFKIVFLNYADLTPFSMWYMFIYWTIPPIMIGFATKDIAPIDDKKGLKDYSVGYLFMTLGLLLTALLIFLGIIPSVLFYGF